VRYHMIRTTVTAPMQALYLPHLSLMPAVHIHLITTILQEGCKLLQGLPATIVHLTFIHRNRAGMVTVQRTLGILTEIVVSGSIGIRVGSGVDHRIPGVHCYLLRPLPPCAEPVSNFPFIGLPFSREFVTPIVRVSSMSVSWAFFCQ